MTAVQSSPFRRYPVALELLRRFIRRLRLAKVKSLAQCKVGWGKVVNIGRSADLRAPNFITFGDFVSVGRNFTCEANLRVGSHVLISSNVAVVGKDHAFDDPHKTVYTQGRLENSLVTIGNDVLIGFGSIIVGSVTIGDGCIVGAGSVVASDLPPNMICVGVPARPIRNRYSPVSEREAAALGDFEHAMDKRR